MEEFFDYSESILVNFRFQGSFYNFVLLGVNFLNPSNPALYLGCFLLGTIHCLAQGYFHERRIRYHFFFNHFFFFRFLFFTWLSWFFNNRLFRNFLGCLNTQLYLFFPAVDFQDFYIHLITFANNLWYAWDAPAQSQPALPSPETNGIYGVDPDLGPGYRIGPGSPAAGTGVTSPWSDGDHDGACFATPPSRGAFEVP